MGLDDLVNKAKDALGGSDKDGLIEKTKEQLTDERIDQVADAIKKVTPDHIDEKVDQLAEQAKKLND